MNSTTKAFEAPSGAPAALAAVSSPSLMVFLIRPTSGVLKGGVPVLAQKAGFAWRKDVHGLGLLDHDTAETIATLHTHGFKEAIGELTEIEIRIDPESCAIEWRAGKRLMQAGQTLAELFGANLCGASGGPLSEADRESIAEYIDSSMERRRDAKWAEERRGVTQPDGTRLCLEDGLSFVTTTRSKRGKFIRTNYFDVPPLSYYEGLALGAKLAREMLDFMKLHKTRDNNFEKVMGVVGHTMFETPWGFDTASTCHVARGFMRAMMEMVQFGARHSGYGAWIDSQVSNAERSRQSELEYIQRDKEEFVKRMREAREKKRTQPSVGAIAASTTSTRTVAEMV